MFSVLNGVIQRRVDASVDFESKTWCDYVRGFGDVNGNFWIGLEKMHQLTTAQPMSLEISVTTFTGKPFTIYYKKFSVSDAPSNYKLLVSGYSQSSNRLLYDPLASYHNGLMFTTRDRDNDKRAGLNVASDFFRGGWWYGNETTMNLNGNYEGNVTPTLTGIIVMYIETGMGYRLSKPVKSTEMRIRPRH